MLRSCDGLGKPRKARSDWVSSIADIRRYTFHIAGMSPGSNQMHENESCSYLWACKSRLIRPFRKQLSQVAPRRSDCLNTAWPNAEFNKPPWPELLYIYKDPCCFNTTCSVFYCLGSDKSCEALHK